MTLKTISNQLMYVFLATGLFAVACSKKKGTNNPAPVPDKKLIRVQASATNYSAFEYNTNGTLKKLTTVDDEAGATETTVIEYTYNEQKKITEASINGSVIVKYVYANNRVDKVEFFLGNTKGMYAAIEYNNNRIAKIAQHVLKNGSGTEYEISGRNEYSYYDNGNVKEMKSYVADPSGTLMLSYTQQFEQYDSKPNPLAAFTDHNLGFMLNFSSPANALKEKIVDDNNQQVEETLNTYTYDANGYPLTGVVKTKPSGAAEETTNLTFTYQ